MSWLRGKKHDIALSREQSMSAVPTRSPDIVVERGEKGAATLVVSLRQGNWGNLLNRFLKKPIQAKRRVVLDEIGTCVWDLCDGEKTVRDIVERVVKKFRFNHREGERATLAFLRQLGQRRFIAFVVYRQRGAEEG